MVKIAIIGAGIMGTSTGYRLLKQNPDFDVTIFAKEFTPNTTSDGAAGFWQPYLPGDTPKETIWRLAKETYDYCLNILKSDPDSSKLGLSTVHGYRVSKYEEPENLFWKDIPLDYRVVPKAEVQRRFPAYFKSAISHTSIFIEGRKIIPYFMERIKSMGGKIIQRNLQSIDEIASSFDIVVNCAGLGSRELIGDKNMFPIRGQILMVRAPWVRELIMWQEKEHVSYILPNQNHVVLGGTAHESENKTSSLDHKEWILNSTQKLMPSLARAEILQQWVGFRPGRKGGFRQEIENYKLNNGKYIKVIHNYGHGGSGLTLFWGCSGDTVKSVLQVVEELNVKSKL